MKESAETLYGNIIEPSPVAFSLDAPGWYFLFAVIGASLIVWLLLTLRNYRRNKYKREALVWLDTLESKWIEDEAALLYHSHILLKRLALRAANRADSAALTGSKWIDFLNSSCKKIEFNGADSILIQDLVYNSESISNRETLEAHMKKIRYWISHHRLS